MLAINVTQETTLSEPSSEGLVYEIHSSPLVNLWIHLGFFKWCSGLYRNKKF